MKENKLIKNPAGGYDLMTERDCGNHVRILTGSPQWSSKYFRSIKRLSEKALMLLKGENDAKEVPDEMPEWEELNDKLIEDNRILLAALHKMKRIETHADSLIDTGMVDVPHTKAMRAMVQTAQEAINKTTNEIYNITV